ncbi:MAG: NACHT domain-containing protein [Alphaproteobacteria bacterium]
MTFFREFLDGMPNHQKMFVFTLLLGTVAIGVAMFLGDDLITRLGVPICVIIIIWVSRPLWLPEDGRTLIRKASLTVLLGTVPIVLGYGDTLDRKLSILLTGHLNWAPPTSSGFGALTQALVLVFVWSGVAVVNYFVRDRTVVGRHSGRIDVDFPERNYKERRNDFCRVLKNKLHAVDHETNWSAQYFTPLDADVDVTSGYRHRRRVADLISAIRRDRKSRAFLVLGDPGSGKSVALRKLCQDLIDEVPRTNRVPVYVNLKEWATAEPWSMNRPPTTDDLRDFIVGSLKLDRFSKVFIEEYFDKMQEHGYFFFVLDSFDEIPAVLDQDESAWIVRALSGVVSQFIAGAHESRGLVSSRYYRRPQLSIEHLSTLELRPFSEAKIARTLRNYLDHPDETLRELFRKRGVDLVPSARNPFIAGLIGDYANQNRNRLPPNQVDLYRNYIEKSLDQCADRMKALRLSRDEVLETATTVALHMFTTPSLGLEAPIRELVASFPSLRIADVVDVLCFARIGRGNATTDGRFSFVHRRFNEYFLVRNLLDGRRGLPLEDIPQDRRWRDALVLYAEVAPEANAKRIALYCWETISKNAQINSLWAIRCLRFLADAFRSRRELLEPFAQELASFVKIKIQGGEQDIVSAKLAVEAVGLLEEGTTEQVLLMALDLRNPWVSETAFRACRYLGHIGVHLRSKLRDYLCTIHPRNLLQMRKELWFFLGITEVFSGLRWYFAALIADSVLYHMSLLVSFLLFPVAMPLAVLGAVTVESGIFGRLGRPSRAYYIEREISTTRLFAFTVLISIFNPILHSPIEYYMKLSPFEYANRHLDLSHSSINMIVTVLCGTMFSFVKLPYMKRVFFSMYWNTYSTIYLLAFAALSLSYLIFYENIIATIKIYVVDYDLTMTSLYFVSIVIGAVIVCFAISYVSLIFLKDDRGLKNSMASPPRTREEIARQFALLRSVWYRRAYVTWLARKAPVPEGQWPDGCAPTLGSDEASVALARLEERWLGLER